MEVFIQGREIFNHNNLKQGKDIGRNFRKE